VRVLVDTSVWSLALRKRGPADHPSVAKLTAMIGLDDLAITGSILQEVLQTYRDEETFSALARYLLPYPLLALDRETCTEAARLHRRCAARGIAAKTIDCQIAAAALRHDHKLLSADADFEQIARVSELQLL